jgi:hypothetical protein
LDLDNARPQDYLERGHWTSSCTVLQNPPMTWHYYSLVMLRIEKQAIWILPPNLHKQKHLHLHETLSFKYFPLQVQTSFLPRFFYRADNTEMEPRLLRWSISLIFCLPLAHTRDAYYSPAATSTYYATTTEDSAFPTVTSFPGCTGYCEDCASSVQADYFSTWDVYNTYMASYDLNLAGHLFFCIE